MYVHLNQNLLQIGRFQPFLRMSLVQWRTDLVAQNSFKSRSCSGLPLQVLHHSFFALLVSATSCFPISKLVLILLLPTFPLLALYPEGLIWFCALWLDRKTILSKVLRLFPLWFLFRSDNLVADLLFWIWTCFDPVATNTFSAYSLFRRTNSVLLNCGRSGFPSGF